MLLSSGGEGVIFGIWDGTENLSLRYRDSRQFDRVALSKRLGVWEDEVTIDRQTLHTSNLISCKRTNRARIMRSTLPSFLPTYLLTYVLVTYIDKFH